MSQAFSKSSNNYSVLYRFSNVPYTPKSSWTNSTEFVSDPVKDKSVFELNQMMISKEFDFIPDPIFGSTSWTRTSNT